MQHRSLLASILVGGLLAAAGAAILAAGAAPPAAPPAAAPPSPPPRPRRGHPYLNALVGEWEVSFVTVDPTGKSHEVKGTSKIVLGVGGTAILEDYECRMPEGPFAGHGITKLSDDGKTVNAWWFDNMGPEPMKLTGTVTETTIEISGTVPGM